MGESLLDSGEHGLQQQLLHHFQRFVLNCTFAIGREWQHSAEPGFGHNQIRRSGLTVQARDRLQRLLADGCVIYANERQDQILVT
jgi:hypothetical protein